MTETKFVSPKAHVALHVRDLARSVDFYRKLFGAEPVKRRPGYAKFDIVQPPLNFTLNESPRPRRPLPVRSRTLAVKNRLHRASPRDPRPLEQGRARYARRDAHGMLLRLAG